MERVCIDGFTNLRIYQFENVHKCGNRRCRIPVMLANETTRHRGCTSRWVNPRAEALKARTSDFALQIIRFCKVLRKTWEGAELSDQLFGAGTRVGANYRAACRGRSRADFILKLGHVVEEAEESCYWLEPIKAAAIVDSNELAL